MFEIKFDDVIKDKVGGLQVLQVEAEVNNGSTSDMLWEEIVQETTRIKSLFTIDRIAKRPAISATRCAYKAIGKDPNRYRPSAEALCRRVANGKGLYRLTTVVDLINLVSLVTGYSIGGFDCDKIKGDTLVLGVGGHDEPFEAIGRGILNIEFLPVYRDSIGGIGTPTSDCERTKLTEQTQNLLMLVNIYGLETSVEDTTNLINGLLLKYAEAENIRFKLLAID